MKAKKLQFFWLWLIAVLMICAGCNIDSYNPSELAAEDAERNAKRVAELLAATPPVIHESKEPFTLGGLIKPTVDNPWWSVAYGNFPAIMSVDSLSGLGEGFAAAFLGFPGRNAEYEFTHSADKYYTMTCFLGKGAYGGLYYDPEQDLRFEEDAPKNLLLMTDFNEGDRQNLESGGPVDVVRIARGALSLITSKDNPVENMTSVQTKAVLSGEITNWSELGGEDVPIGLYYDWDEEMFRLLDSAMLHGAERTGPVETEAPMGRQMVPVRVPYENQLGAISIVFSSGAADIAGAKTLAIDGFLPEANAIRSGEYALAYDCYAVYREADADGSPGRFIEWIFSEEGSDLLINTGFVPVEEVVK